MAIPCCPRDCEDTENVWVANAKISVNNIFILLFFEIKFISIKKLTTDKEAIIEPLNFSRSDA